jgi:hypothetical protein
MRAIFAVLVLCVPLLAGHAQDSDSSAPGPAAQGHSHVNPPPPTPAEIELQKRLARQRNQERFTRVKKDTDQLLELATQLKKSVDEANDQTLSLEVIRKAEQIEKLAKQVRQKMAGE